MSRVMAEIEMPIVEGVSYDNALYIEKMIGETYAECGFDIFLHSGKGHGKWDIVGRHVGLTKLFISNPEAFAFDLKDGDKI
jgi:hypothetical protein